ncbi:MAG: DUF4338 domain-containing protein [Gemmatimonadota bacterium]
MSGQLRFCGRNFTAVELETVRSVIAEHPDANRARLSRMVCEVLGWRRPDGRLKDMSCRVAMLRMQDGGVIRLPPPTTGNGNGQPYRRRTPEAEPEQCCTTASAGHLPDLHLELVQGRQASHLWNELVERYHYLGYQPLPGAQLRYFAQAGGRCLAVLGFGAAAWKTAPRDRFIGWTAAQREARLHLVLNNARFLILPWVRSRHLASCLLGMASRRIAQDCHERYGYRPVLLETFVETPRFAGTCYQAANWRCLGETTGRGKLSRTKKAVLPRKTVWVYPLDRHFRLVLCG